MMVASLAPMLRADSINVCCLRTNVLPRTSRAKANELPDPIPEEIQEERFHRFMELQQKISARRLAAKVGRQLDVIVDEVDEEGAIGRSMADAPEIDGAVYMNGETNVKPGDILRVKVENADEYDLWGTRV